jgi:hypothetical protein
MLTVYSYLGFHCKPVLELVEASLPRSSGISEVLVCQNANWTTEKDANDHVVSKTNL